MVAAEMEKERTPTRTWTPFLFRSLPALRPDVSCEDERFRVGPTVEGTAECDDVAVGLDSGCAEFSSVDGLRWFGAADSEGRVERAVCIELRDCERWTGAAGSDIDVADEHDLAVRLEPRESREARAISGALTWKLGYRSKCIRPERPSRPRRCRRSNR